MLFDKSSSARGPTPARARIGVVRVFSAEDAPASVGMVTKASIGTGIVKRREHACRCQVGLGRRALQSVARWIVAVALRAPANAAEGRRTAQSAARAPTSCCCARGTRWRLWSRTRLTPSGATTKTFRRFRTGCTPTRPSTRAKISLTDSRDALRSPAVLSHAEYGTQIGGGSLSMNSTTRLVDCRKGAARSGARRRRRKNAAQWKRTYWITKRRPPALQERRNRQAKPAPWANAAASACTPHANIAEDIKKASRAIGAAAHDVTYRGRFATKMRLGSARRWARRSGRRATTCRRGARKRAASRGGCARSRRALRRLASRGTSTPTTNLDDVRIPTALFVPR